MTGFIPPHLGHAGFDFLLEERGEFAVGADERRLPIDLGDDALTLTLSLRAAKRRSSLHLVAGRLRAEYSVGLRASQ
jgi:hypothetical protein